MQSMLMIVVAVAVLLVVWERWGKALLAAAVIAVLTLSLAAYAADGSSAAAPVMASWWSATVLPAVLLFITNPMVWAIIGGLLWFQFAAKSKYATVLRFAIDTAFHAVEDMKAQGKLPDSMSKEAAALEKLETIMATAGGYKLSDAGIELAKIAWQAMNAQKSAGSLITTQANP